MKVFEVLSAAGPPGDAPGLRPYVSSPADMWS